MIRNTIRTTTEFLTVAVCPFHTDDCHIWDRSPAPRLIYLRDKQALVISDVEKPVGNDKRRDFHRGLHRPALNSYNKFM
jgi:hypothetical protein